MKYLFELNQYNQQRQFEKPVWVYPAHLAMYATYLVNKGHEILWGDEKLFWKMDDSGKVMEDVDKIIKDDTQIDVPFEDLPYPDRTLTDAKHKRWQSYGNYKFHPATHSMFSNLCWYGKCTFCIDTKKLEEGEPRGLRTVENCLDEVENCISLGYKEIFDDSGTFPVGDWLSRFCHQMKSWGYDKKITMGCNMKPVKIDYDMMGQAGFRFMLVGVESINQITIDKIQKGQKSGDIEPILKSMADAGLEPHGTFMTGYPWETEEDEKRTIKFCHDMLKKGYLKTAQASVYSPPRTKPDMDSVGHKYLPRFYDVYRSPVFWIQKWKDFKRWEDFTYMMRGARLVVEEKIRKGFQ